MSSPGQIPAAHKGTQEDLKRSDGVGPRVSSYGYPYELQEGVDEVGELAEEVERAQVDILPQ